MAGQHRGNNKIIELVEPVVSFGHVIQLSSGNASMYTMASIQKETGLSGITSYDHNWVYPILSYLQQSTQTYFYAPSGVLAFRVHF